MTPNSPEEIATRLALWASDPAPGMCLVEYHSEYARAETLRLLREQISTPIHEQSFAISDDLERDVRALVESIATHPNALLSISGLDAAYPHLEDKRRVIGLLNFLRERIAQFHGKQIWWLSTEAESLMLREAPDLHSWFAPRMELRAPAASAPTSAPEPFQPTLSIAEAHQRLRDARERIHRATATAESREIWRSLAEPAIAALRRAGQFQEAAQAREEFLDQIYGDVHNATRADRIRGDITALLNSKDYFAAEALAGDGDNLLLEGATPERQREIWKQLGIAKGQGSNPAEASRYFRILRDSLQGEAGSADLARKAELAAASHNLSVSLQAAGETVEANKTATEAVELFRALAAQAPHLHEPKLAMALENLASSHRRLGNGEDAATLAREAITLFRKLDGPGGATYRADIARTQSHLVASLQNLGNFEEALAEAEQASVIYRQLAAERPDVYRNDLATTLSNLAVLLLKMERNEEAHAAASEAVKIIRDLVSTRPEAFLSELPAALQSHALSALALGHTQEAYAACTEAVEASRRLFAMHPERFRSTLTGNLAALSGHLAQAQRPAEAAEVCREALLTILPSLGQDNPYTRAMAESLRINYKNRCKEAGTPPDRGLLAKLAKSI